MAVLQSSLRPTDAEAPDPKRWLTLAVIAIAQLMIVLDATIVTIALPSAQKSLHISLLDRQWVLTAYALTFGGLLLLGGRIADFVGRKRILIIGLIGFALASALGGVAQNGGMLFAARALQGSFGAIMAPAALSIITTTFTEPTERAKAFAVYGGIAGGGAAIGLLAGGVLTEYASWRWCLLVNIPVALIACIGAIALVRESRIEGPHRHYDVPGAIVSTAGFVALVFGFTKADQDGWSSYVTVSFLVAAVVLLTGFVIYESRKEDPLLPVRILTERNRGGSYLGSFMAGIGLFGMFLFLTYYLQGTLHYSPLKCGVAYLPFSGGIVVAAAAASKVMPKVGPRIPMVGGFLASAAGLAWLTTLGLHSSYLTRILPAEVIMSLGLGFAFVCLSSTALYGVNPRDAGVASALVNSTQQIGGSLGTALLNTIAASATASYISSHAPSHLRLPHALVHGYTVSFTWSVALVGLAALVSFVLVQSSGMPKDHTSVEVIEDMLVEPAVL